MVRRVLARAFGLTHRRWQFDVFPSRLPGLYEAPFVKNFLDPIQKSS